MNDAYKRFLDEADANDFLPATSPEPQPEPRCDACNIVAVNAHTCAGFRVCCDCFAKQAGVNEEGLTILSKTVRVWDEALFSIMCMGNDPDKNCLEGAVGVAEQAYKSVDRPGRLTYGKPKLPWASSWKQKAKEWREHCLLVIAEGHRKSEQLQQAQEERNLEVERLTKDLKDVADDRNAFEAERDAAREDRDFVQYGLNSCVDDCNALRGDMADIELERQVIASERDALLARVQKLEGALERACQHLNEHGISAIEHRAALESNKGTEP